MLGAARSSLMSSFTPADYSVFVSPNELTASIRKGVTTTPAATANVTGGVGPFTFLWTIDNASITINSDDEESTTFTAGGIEQIREGIATVTVTDTGNGNLEKEGSTNLTFIFGNPA